MPIIPTPGGGSYEEKEAEASLSHVVSSVSLGYMRLSKNKNYVKCLHYLYIHMYEHNICMSVHMKFKKQNVSSY